MKPWLLTINDANRSTLWVGVFRTCDLTRRDLCDILMKEYDNESDTTKKATLIAAEQIIKNMRVDRLNLGFDECVRVAGQTVGYVTYERVFEL